MRGSWDLAAVRALPPAPLAAERPICPHETYVRNFRSVLERASIRSPSRDYIHHIFPTGSPVQKSVRLHRKTHQLLFSSGSSNRTASMGTRFSVRVIAHERHLLLSFYLPPQDFLYASTIANGRHFSLFFYLLPSIDLLEQFLERHHARDTSELAGRNVTRATDEPTCALHLKHVCFCFCVFCVLVSHGFVPS